MRKNVLLLLTLVLMCMGLSVAIPTSDAFAKKDEKVLTVCTSSCNESSQSSHTTYYQTYYLCKAWFCDNRIFATPTGSEANSDSNCWTLNSFENSGMYCSQCDKCWLCGRAGKKTHYDYKMEVTKCSECREELKEEEISKIANNATSCSKSTTYKSTVGDCCVKCPRPSCRQPAWNKVHTHVIVRKYTGCGHTKKETKYDQRGQCYIDPPLEIEVKGPLGSPSYCGGNNDQNDKCECGGKFFKKWKGIPIDIKICLKKRGWGHWMYTITAEHCLGCKYTRFDYKKSPQYGECHVFPDTIVPIIWRTCARCEK